MLFLRGGFDEQRERRVLASPASVHPEPPTPYRVRILLLYACADGPPAGALHVRTAQEVFYVTPLSFAMVNLGPVLPLRREGEGTEAET
ncbi:hypothetical protein QJS04_geneDACA016942 [Acorus gramineus]|uniref:Uncharacterized protein n=1 Tax=Acorus gramineus TaxID=55184 RepID=A0AAV9AMT9_ACOGR|nr:hypothetical protein QJS04_geneDACA016942 [Acorus gramineus]